MIHGLESKISRLRSDYEPNTDESEFTNKSKCSKAIAMLINVDIHRVLHQSGCNGANNTNVNESYECLVDS